MNLRPTQRIPELLTALKDVWMRSSNLRFFQIIEALQTLYSERKNNVYAKEVIYMISNNKGIVLDLFYVEDDDTIAFLHTLIGGKTNTHDDTDEDISRISDLIQVFEEVWLKYPDMRFFQLIDSLKDLYAKADGAIIPKKYTYQLDKHFQEEGTFLDAFYVKDDKFIDFLKTML